MTVPTRRSLGASAVALLSFSAFAARSQAAAKTETPSPARAVTAAHGSLAALEAENGGRLGVMAFDVSRGQDIRYRSDEHFAMCSTHKFLTAAAILSMIDRGQLSLDAPIPYSSADLLDYAPITKKNVGAGFMTTEELCAASLQWSDNTAANLLLGQIGGPAGWTRYARLLGDTISRLDRNEPTLNTAIPDDPRDTTTPEAMARNLEVVLTGNALSEPSRKRLLAWLLGSTANLLRAGLPEGWRVGDKSGSGEHNTRCDVGIMLRPEEATPIVAAVYYTDSSRPVASQDKVIADTGRIIAQAFSA